jgi:site-specific DNA recombinase
MFPSPIYDAIEAGVADLDDPALKDRIVGLKATRDQAQADALRAQAMLEGAARQAVTPQMLRQFANTARIRMRAVEAATAATTFGSWLSGSRLQTRKSASRGPRAVCSETWSPYLALA